MSLTVPVIEKIKTTANVSAVSSGKHVAFSQVDGLLNIDGNEISLPPITCIFEYSYGDLIVGTRDGIYTFRDGNELRFEEFTQGIESFHGKGDYCVAIDGLGKAHIISASGEITQIQQSSVLFVSLGENIAIATEAGEVFTYNTKGDMIWKRPIRGEVGERITAIGWNNSQLIVAREGHGLVPGEEEALEVEFWRNQNLEKRIDVKSRVVSIQGDWMGLDMGGVMHGEQIIFEMQHPVNRIIDRGSYALVASWFHLHKITSEGLEWSVETQGMAELVSSNDSSNLVMIAGSDQNDYTDSEPVVIIDANATPVPLIEEDSAIDDWGEAPSIEISAEESIEELAGFSSNLQLDESAIFDALNDEIVSEEEIEEEEDLMYALSLDAEQVIAPTPNAGGDQSVKADEDGTAIVKLDGSETDDPQDRILSWSWIDGTGKEISDSPVLQVRLAKGSHNFELRIKDKDGRWSSDSIDVRVD